MADDLLAVRRAKLDALRAEGVDPFPHAYPGVAPIAEVKAPHEGLADGEETEVTARVAGRLHARRGQGKAQFLDLVDRSGSMQLLARLNVLGEEQFARLRDHVDLGDLIGADGTVIKTRSGELSLSVTHVQVLAKALRPPPDKFHGLSDTETRFRHRELDLMSSPEARALFVTRAKIISAIRRFLDDAAFVEVETPVLQPLYGGAAARPFTTHFNALEQDMYLRIATELYLKRCIVGGLERVYELGKDFRNEGLSTKHNPEFTMLEFYEAYADYNDIADRYEAMLAYVAEAIGYDGDVRFGEPFARETFGGAILDRTGVDIYADRTLDGLQEQMRAKGLGIPDHETTWARLVDHLLSKYVEPELIQPTFLMDYPVELSPFAKKHRVDGRAGRALRVLRGRHGDRQRVHRAQRPRRPARAVRGAARGGHGRRRGGPAVRRGVPRRAGAGDAAHGRDRHGHRPVDDPAHGRELDPRGRAVPRPTQLTYTS